MSEPLPPTGEQPAACLQSRLCAPFQLTEVKFKPQSVKGNRALALAYIDCRVIQDRLDDVLGVENWQDEYDILNDGSVMCRLKLRFAGEWVAKVDVGSPSEQPDSGDRLKAAFSDALKRAAIKFGIGRYLYRLPAVWCDYDPQKKQFSGTPQLPAWAVPKAKGPAPAARPADPTPQPQTTKSEFSSVAGLLAAAQRKEFPPTGVSLADRVAWFDRELLKLCPPAAPFKSGSLIHHVCEQMKCGSLQQLASLQMPEPVAAGWRAVLSYLDSLNAVILATTGKSPPANTTTQR